jgi:hypothetical protein
VTERPRSSFAGTTDTDTFAEYKSASHGKFARSTSASRIEDKTEQKRSAGFPPFEPPAGGRQQYPLVQKTQLSWLWIAGLVLRPTAALARRRIGRLLRRARGPRKMSVDFSFHLLSTKPESFIFWRACVGQTALPILFVC